MSSKPSPSPSSSRSESLKDASMEGAEESGPTSEEIGSIIESLKTLVADERFVSIKERIKENRNKLASVTSHLQKLSKERRNSWINIGDYSQDLLQKRQDEAVGMHSGVGTSNGDRDSDSHQEDSHAPTAVLLGSSIPPGKNSVRPIKLPGVKKLPPYTTWIFLDRNQRMTEDQSVVGRRRIYYDSGEAVICSDSEEEAVDDEEEKRFFLASEDYILSTTIKKTGLSNGVIQSLAECLSRSTDEVKARYENLTKEEKPSVDSINADSETQTVNSFLEKDLEAALDSFDNLFCRRCLVFDCRLHGCSQDLVFPVSWLCKIEHDTEKQLLSSFKCKCQVSKSEKLATLNSPELGDTKENSLQPSGSAGTRMSARKKSTSSTRKKAKPSQSESASSNVKNMSESSDSENEPQQDTSSTSHLSPSKNKLVGKCGNSHRNSKRVAERVLSCIKKRQKKLIGSDSDSVASGSLLGGDAVSPHKENEDAISSSHKKAKNSSSTRRSRKTEFPVHEVQDAARDGISNQMCTDPPGSSSDNTMKKDAYVDGIRCKPELNHNLSWKAFEKSIFEKGVEIFGRNSCLITRNLLNGLKTCTEVFQYMTRGDNKLGLQAGDVANSLGEGYSKFDHQGNNEVRRRSRFLRRRGKVRRLKYSWKSTAYHSIRKRISDKKDQPCRQYNPCGCETACGKQCACSLNGTCCEKYCGCPKSCKNRFRGCHCAKSQCRSRQCPCFAADRECDPDVCRNCWVGCGDGSLGVPNQSGDNYECRNMKLLLKQQQRVLLGRSNVSGWGAFLKNSVGKHDYLGEYTGELISHREADKRGKIYDRENSSFLFNLNDQFVLDAYRKGDKLKFANHSPDPNCYAKVIMVAGDHRVGIFAKERIGAGEELFYDYRYEPDRAPAWARKPEASGSKKEETGHTSGRAKKLA
ncbi:Histone-lysine N-methyltransferase CLF [Linum perenne]